METQKITAAAIVNGSRQVNLWREEIKLVTTTLLGLVKIGLRLEERRLINCGTRINWVLDVSAGCVTSISLQIDDSGIRTIYSTNWTASFSVEGPLVTHVHQCLDKLVSGMIEIFPELSTRLKFLADAAMAAG